MCITYALVVECLIFSWITTYLYKIDDHFSFRICIFIEHDVIAWKIFTNLLKQKCEQLFFDLGFTVLMIYLWNCLPKYFRWQWPPLWLTACTLVSNNFWNFNHVHDWELVHLNFSRIWDFSFWYRKYICLTHKINTY